MADQNAIEVVRQVVQQRVASGQMFTAYDVTVQARDQGARIRHGEARDIVHGMFQSGDMGASYQRSVVDIGVAVKPFVYHRFDVDPRTYRSTASNAGGESSPSVAKPGFVQRVLRTIWGGTDVPNSSDAPAAPQPRSPAAPRRPRRREDVTLDLDASDYLPITRDELLAESKKMNLWASPWFGRRDLIPPVDDARTKLIDRAMVAQGLLSPEQLAEIHRIGAEMDHYRPDPLLLRHQSQLAGKEAVENDRRRRAEEKRKKKEEAAARREARRAQIEHRRENDIVFLGDGVSQELHDRDSDTDQLQANGLPVLSTPQDLAQAMDLSIPELRWLAFHNPVATRTHYIYFTTPKKSGGLRELCKPHDRLERAQRWVFEQILQRLPTEDAAHGFVPGRSIATNAAVHVGQAVVLNMDLEGFFPNITFYRVRAFFKTLGYSPAVATLISLLCTETPRRRVEYAGQSYFVATGKLGLPQGACTSPSISNQIAKRLDRRLQGLARSLSIKFTRYADDISISGNDGLESRLGYVMACVRHVAEDEGFLINPKKTRVLRRHQSQVVTGLVTNDHVAVPRKKIRLIRAILHNARKHGLESQNRESHPNFRSWLEGHISYIAMTRPEVGAKLLRELRAIDES